MADFWNPVFLTSGISSEDPAKEPPADEANEQPGEETPVDEANEQPGEETPIDEANEQPGEETPVDEANDPPGEETPAYVVEESTAPATEETTEPVTVETTEPAPDPPGPGPEIPTWGWISMGFAAGILLALIVTAAMRLFRQKKKPKVEPPVRKGIGDITVEKLHQQGARESQQDCFSVSADELRPTHGLLAVVADGMGGLSNGDKVSQAAVMAMMNGFYSAQGNPEQVLLTLLAMANQAVNQYLGPNGLYSGGSTLIAGLIRDDAFHYLSVGDSSICLFRDGTLTQLNRPHVFRNELYLRAVNGEMSFRAAVEHPKAAGLTSFLGMGQLKYVDMPAQGVPIRPGDKFILMSDGVYNALTTQELIDALRLDSGAAEAMHTAIAAKGYTNQDNYTAVILAC